jgi:hypothetical protein
LKKKFWKAIFSCRHVFPDIDSNTFFDLTMEHLKVLCPNIADAITLDVKLCQNRSTVSKSGKNDLPTTKDAIFNIPDFDLHCIISANEKVPSYKLSVSDVSDIATSVMKFVLVKNPDVK